MSPNERRLLMAWKKIDYKLTSSAPLIMHNGQTADPTNKWSKLIKQISSKRTKTDADYEEMARLEFMAGLYLDENGPILPAFVIDSLVINGAKKSKEGQVAKSGCFCPHYAKLEYDGPRTADELWADEQFRFSAIVRIGQSRVARMRPIFREWSAVITLNAEDTMVNPARVEEWLVAAGTQVGVGDWRPQNGRFTVERIEGKK
jgi:hypothetical protein